jgi:hypothetical protein
MAALDAALSRAHAVAAWFAGGRVAASTESDEDERMEDATGNEPA